MNTISFANDRIAPSKIICIGRNYLEHIHELGNETPEAMVIFCKPNSAISESLQARLDETLHYEGEICFMVKRGQLHAVGFGLDLTKRELQSKLKAAGLPWERAKAFDGAACFSEFVALGNTDIASLELSLEINGEVIQQGGYELMMHKPADILSAVRRFMSLEDGDIIMSGTPGGVGKVQRGDRFVGSVKSAGRLMLSQEWIAE